MQFLQASPRTRNDAGPSAGGLRWVRAASMALTAAVVLLGCVPYLSTGLAAQKANQKNKKDDSEAAEIASPIAPPDGQARTAI